MTAQQYTPKMDISPQRRAELISEVALGNENLLEFISAEKDSYDFSKYLEMMEGLVVLHRKSIERRLPQDPISVTILAHPIKNDFSKPEYQQLLDFASRRAGSILENELIQRGIIAYVHSEIGGAG
jgi:hypothetical protein